ncbi:MAG: 30S ribosomal protein S21 [Candidatus Pacebacteria bacterium]|nr:30S ribosomal protein S21 [Candidatus Paceibacterota bacterium]
MAIVIKAKKSESTNDLIRKFKKAVAATGVVQIVKDRRYFRKPSKIKAEKTANDNRLKRRARSLKKMKNVSPAALARINQKLGKT